MLLQRLFSQVLGKVQIDENLLAIEDAEQAIKQLLSDVHQEVQQSLETYLHLCSIGALRIRKDTRRNSLLFYLPISYVSLVPNIALLPLLCFEANEGTGGKHEPSSCNMCSLFILSCKAGVSNFTGAPHGPWAS